jgi:hypothetical protein
MDEKTDPLDELRDMAAGGTGVARELRRIAVAWDNERDCRNFCYDTLRNEMQAKYEAECSANDRLRTEVKWLTAERDELMAKLDASMPLPIDADGEVIRPGDMVCDKVHGTFPACEVGYLDDGRVKVYQNDHICAMASAVRHASKPETIEDVREDVSGNVCKYFGYGSRSTCDKCPADGSEDCGNVKAADLVERAYECGLKDGGDDARD